MLMCMETELCCGDTTAGQDKPHTLRCIQLDGGILVIISQLNLISYRILYHKCFYGKEPSMANPLRFRCGTTKGYLAVW